MTLSSTLSVPDMCFSVGILYSAQHLIRLVKDDLCIGESFPEVFKTFLLASPRAVLEVSQKCDWVSLNASGTLQVTPQGESVLGCRSPAAALRLQLTHMIREYLPAWSSLLSRGRAEAVPFLPADVQQCLREAGVLSGVSEEVVRWWDALAQSARGKTAEDHLSVGRFGEKLSLEFEEKRTNHRAVWQAIESNLCGYDLLSRVSEQDPTPLRIEVKTSSSRASVAQMHVSCGEWSVARSSDQYVFHLWALEPTPTLYLVGVDRVSEHIPITRGAGRWESIMIPFSALTDASDSYQAVARAH